MINYDMSKLQVGEVYGYKQICDLIGAKYKNGRGRVLQFQNMTETGFPRFFKAEKVAYGKYRINEIYDDPLPVYDKRVLGNASGIHHISKSLQDNPHFGIEDENIALNAGVYKIENNDSVYIGSTINKLSQRFCDHFKNYCGMQPKTQEALFNNGEFNCLQSFELGSDEQEIRDCEAYYIWKYQNQNKKLLNTELPALVKKGEQNIQYENLKIPSEMYNEVLDYLRDGGFLVMKKSMYNKRFEEVEE